MRKSIDARGLACPQPVIETKNIIEQGNFSILEIIVDNIAARENVKRFVSKAGFTISDIVEKEGDFHLIVESNNSADTPQIDVNINKYQCAIPQVTTKSIFISTDKIGSGSDELGQKLMKAFLYSLAEISETPARLIFMNAGVKLCAEDSETVENIQRLQDMNVEILVCGTCLDYYNLTDKLGVGKISNMYDISAHLVGNDPVFTI